ncbi:MAG: transketolase family protein, partial [Terrimicrobiaceae bacterium]
MKALRDVFGDTLVALGWTNPNVVVLDADLANSTKADKFAMAYPDRFLQMGIAEQNFIGVAVGLASLGFVPWLSTFTVFFTHRAIDPIRMLVAQTHANVKIGAAYSGLLTGLTGKTHQDVQDIAIMRAMPDMTVLAPADAIEGEAIIRWATEFQGPVYLRLARDPSPDVFDDKYSFVPGKTILLREGSDVLLISTGPQSVRCKQAAELL